MIKKEKRVISRRTAEEGAFHTIEKVEVIHDRPAISYTFGVLHFVLTTVAVGSLAAEAFLGIPSLKWLLEGQGKGVFVGLVIAWLVLGFIFISSSSHETHEKIEWKQNSWPVAACGV